MRSRAEDLELDLKQNGIRVADGGPPHWRGPGPKITIETTFTCIKAKSECLLF